MASSADDVSDGGAGETRLDGGDGGIDAVMQRAEAVGVGTEAEWAMLDAFERIDGVDHLEDRQRPRLAGQDESAVQAAAGGDDACPGERLEHLDEISGRGAGGLGDLVDLLRLVGVIGKVDHRPERVLNCLAEQFHVICSIESATWKDVLRFRLRISGQALDER